MSANLIHCRTRGGAGPPVVPAEELWLSVAGILRADPDQDATSGYIRIVPTDADRPSFAIIPPTGTDKPDPLSVIVWWLGVAAAVGTTSGAFG